MALQTEVFQMLTSNRVLSCIIFVYLYYGPFLYMSLCQHVIFPGRKGVMLVMVTQSCCNWNRLSYVSGDWPG